MTIQNSSSGKPDLTRRRFLRNTAATGAALSYSKMAARAAGASDTLNVALVGCGAQGHALKGSSLHIPNIKFVAVCDLWEVQAKKMARGIASDVKIYTDMEVMLKAHPEIDCVLIAVPDFLHAPFTRLGLQAGKHVYCEKMMSNSLEAAADMVKAQRETGKLLQIGHQRRSNPRYQFMRNTLLRQKNLLGQVTTLYGQWNRSVKPPNEPKGGIEQSVLVANGYKNMFEYTNWRWFEKYGGGPISDLGAHQIDIFNWITGTTPKAITACGGLDYFKDRDLPSGNGKYSYEHLDTAMVIYEYDMPVYENGLIVMEGDKPKTNLVRALYQVLTTNGSQNYYEKVMGVEGTIVISEPIAYNQVYREKDTTSGKIGQWEALARAGYIRKPPATVYNKFWERPIAWHLPEKWLATEGTQDVRVSIPADPYELPQMPKEMDEKPPHQFHLENFFNTVRAGGKQTDLNCPVSEAYKCAVAVLKINEAVKQGKRLKFQPSDFVVA
ncbi:MAG: Gfo/Idh/MocA family oxidoreductase [Verrucomicrobiota bacterium]